MLQRTKQTTKYTYAQTLIYTIKDMHKISTTSPVKVSARQQCEYEGPLAKKSMANERKEHNV